ncbi:MAG: DUF6603 domain-containing protein [Bacteroidota bacterium]
MSQNTLEQVSQEVAAIFNPLLELTDANRITLLFHDLGYQLPDGNSFGTINDLITKVSALVGAVESLASASTDEEKWDAVQNILGKIIDVIASITDKSDDLQGELAVIPGFLANSEIDQLPKRLLDYLLMMYMYNHRYKGYGLLLFIGLFDEIEQEEDLSKFQPAFTLRKIWWDRLPKYFTAPQELPEILYKWESDFDHQLFLQRLYILLRGFRLPGGIYPQSEKMRLALGNNSIVLKELRMPIFERAAWPGLFSQFGLTVSPVEQQGPKKPGFAMLPYVFGAAEFDFDISEKLEITFETTASLDTGLGVVLRPNGAEFITNFFDAPLDSVDVHASMGIRQKEDTGEIVLVGSPNASRFAIEGPGARVFATKSNEADVGFEIDLRAIRLIISGGDGDGFLAKVLGDNGVNVEAGMTLGFSLKDGFYIRGSGGLEIRLPTHVSVGPIELQEAIIGIKFRDGDIVLDAGTTIKLELGPFTAIVENMGLTSTLNFPDGGGNLGPADLSFSFKPPTGLGLSLDTPAVRGGGYLFFDPDNERYGGALELSIQNMFVVTAVGLITTRLPDGSKGFSLLLIISVQFTPGIALGMGFFLSGLGGIIGINRTMNEDALREGVRTGSLDSILFPENVVANITRIITDIRLIFPPQRDQFMIGLMAKITWGVPQLISIEFGLIIEFSNPVRLAILGVIQIALPTEEKALILIKVSFVGIINFDEKYLSFDASLFGSRILTFTLEGDMALRLHWGEEKAFLMSVGGFHPAFEPPARLNVGNMKRLTLNILSGNPRLTLTTYFALTSNTVQFGASIDFFFKVSKFKVVGYFGFDVLFQFSPFRFMAGIRAGVEVMVGSTTLFAISLSFDLAGPTPWSAKGTASFKVLFFKVKVRFSKTWGERKDISMPAIPVLPELLEALGQDRNWVGQVPSGRFVLVSLREVDSEVDGIVLQSFGSLKVSQTVLPLEMDIAKYGNNVPSDILRARINRLRIGGEDMELDEERDSFAPANFTDLDDQDKLKSPSYVKERSGVRVRATDEIKINYAIGREVTYEVRTSDFDRGGDQPYDIFQPLSLQPMGEKMDRFRREARGGAAGRSALSRELKLKKKVPKIQLGGEKFAIAGMENLSRFTSGDFSIGTKAEANDALRKIVRSDPTLKGKLQIVNDYQLTD